MTRIFCQAPFAAAFLFLGLMLSCKGPASLRETSLEYASLLKIEDGKVISFSPYSITSDTLNVDKPLGRIVCMSTPHVAFLDALGCDSVICAVSGTGFITSEALKERIARGEVKDIGYDQAPDYETIVSLKPDIVVSYNVSSTPSPFIHRLESLGIRVFPLYEFMENHPLARAEYIKAFGLMTGRSAAADSIFAFVRDRYNSLTVSTSNPVGVLMNIPYGDLWYVPGADSYMSRLVTDAGGRILGAKEGETSSSVISIEEAFVLSGQADFWLNVGWCRTREDLHRANPVFASFKADKVYNNTRRSTEGGGNDFWESGCLRPDLILQDLKSIFNEDKDTELKYYIEVD